MKKFVKSVWFPILLFVLLEVIFFAIGFFFFEWHALCAMCRPPFESCYCPGGHRGFEMLVIWIIPSAVISIVAYFLAKGSSK
mgnify:CR=1 FL=1|jgi:hypothetical protein